MSDTALHPGDLAGSAGGGGGRSDDDDWGDWWGWSEDPADDEPAYRVPRLRRAVALVTAAAVVAGSMTLLAVVAVGPSASKDAVGDLHLVTLTGDSARSAVVRFVVTNTSSVAGPARCRVWLGSTAHPAATASILTPRLGAGGSAVELVRLRGRTPSSAPFGASCQPAGTS